MQAKNLEEAPFRSRSQIFLSTKKLEKNELQLPLVGACPGVSRDGCLVRYVSSRKGCHTVRTPKAVGLQCRVVGDLFLRGPTTEKCA
ncbi:hypothetical protein FOCG_06601 [Fusarium oxysporum f. sp. radicis-lycopersici 26381]|nr:hypothetical protein FOCG_06601 [Fusarium oxysporum f. sp. radicis-lycopersici 26381]